MRRGLLNLAHWLPSHAARCARCLLLSSRLHPHTVPALCRPLLPQYKEVQELGLLVDKDDQVWALRMGCVVNTGHGV